jgi:hypothetical protein
LLIWAMLEADVPPLTILLEVSLTEGGLFRIKESTKNDRDISPLEVHVVVTNQS